MKELVEGELSYRVTGICFSIHNELGRFLTEKQYCDALAVRLKEQKISFTREPDLDTKFHDEVLKIGRPDFVIEKTIILDVKAKKFITKADYNQMMKYLTLLKKELGLIVNFRASFLKPKRILNPNLHSEHSGGHSGHSDRNAGFTLIELFFVSIFMMVISLYVVGNLNKIRTAQELQNTALDVVSKIRSTQGSVLAGKIIPDEATPPEAYELLFSPN